MCKDPANTRTLRTQHLFITQPRERLPTWLHATINLGNHRRLLLITVIDKHWHTKTQPAGPLNAFISVISGAFRLSRVLGFYLFSSVSFYIIPTAFLLSSRLALGSGPLCAALSAPIIISAFFPFVCLPDFNSSGCSYRYWGHLQLFTIKARKLYALVSFSYFLYYDSWLGQFWIPELKLFISDSIMDWGDDIRFQPRGKPESGGFKMYSASNPSVASTKPQELMSSIWTNQITRSANNNQKQSLFGALSSSDGLMQSVLCD